MDPRPPFTSTLRDKFVVVYDHSEGTGERAVRESARAVVANCLYHHGNRRIIFRDTDGLWRELRHNGKRFVEIVDIAADELETILETCGLEL